MNAQKLCPQCQTPTALQTPVCLRCGHQFRTRFAPPIHQTQVISTPYSAPYSASSIRRGDFYLYLCGIAGACLLAVGVFSPLVAIPIIGSLNIFLNGTQVGWILLAFALAGLVTSACRYWVASGIFGACAFLIIATKAGAVLRYLTLADSPLIQIQWGWLLLLIGALGLLLSGALSIPNKGLCISLVILVIGLATLLGVYIYHTEKRPEIVPTSSTPATIEEDKPVSAPGRSGPMPSIPGNPEPSPGTEYQGFEQTSPSTPYRGSEIGAPYRRGQTGADNKNAFNP
jgi:hypothetical protein